MKYQFDKIFCSLLLVLISLPFYSQNSSDYLFESKLITTEDGLSSLFTKSIFQDSNDYLWIGNQYGLDRYDGYEFKHYNSKINGLNPNGQSLNEIQEDDQNQIWLSYSKVTSDIYWDRPIESIQIFSPELEKAIDLEDYLKEEAEVLKNSKLTLIAVQDPKRRVWLSSLDGALFLYQNKKLKKVYQKEGALFNRLAVDDADNIWIGSKNEVYKLSPQGDLINVFRFDQAVVGLWVAGELEVKIATHFGKIGKITLFEPIHIWSLTKTGEIVPFALKKDSVALEIDHNFGVSPFALYRTNKGFWYAMVSKKLNLFGPQGNWLGAFGNFFEKEMEYRFDDSNSSKDGTCFWCTSPFGLSKASYKKNHFNIVHKTEALSNSRDILEDENGILYISNKDTYKIDPSTGQIDRLLETHGPSLYYRNGLLISSAFSGTAFFHALNLESQEDTMIFKKSISETGVTPGTAINDFLDLEQSNDLLIGTTIGLYYIDPENYSVKAFSKYNQFQSLKKSSVKYLHKNASGIWLASSNGLYLLDEEKGIINHFNSENSNLNFDDLVHIYEDETGVFWMATKGGGLISWKPGSADQSDYKRYTTKDGLSNNYTYAVYEDDFNKLWIPSDLGLMCMDKSTKQIRTYLKEDGLPHNEFNFNSHFQSKDRTLYFGGLGGIISFQPKDFALENKNKTNLLMTLYQLFDEDTENLIDKTNELSQEKSIKLYPSNLFFEMEFTYMDFNDPSKHKFTYKIEGFHKNWNSMESNHLRINNLPYGNYTLKVKAGDLEKGWSSKELSYPIYVIKPFYLRLWFILSLIAFIAISSILAVRWRIRKLQKDKENLENEVKKRTLELEEDKKIIKKQSEDLMELDKVKSRFFSNITHEFRTPLTLIIGPLEQLVDKSSSNFITSKVKGSKIKGALKNANHLLDLLSQLLDLSKLEEGKMPINYAHGDVISFTKDLFQRFKPLAENKLINISFTSDIEKWDIDFDESKWTKIVLNLLSNAIKFTEQEGMIQLGLYQLIKNNEEFIRLVVKDTGQGISKENLDKIFKRFYQIDGTLTRQQEGTGIGLALVKELVELQNGHVHVESSKGEGTTFEIEIPVVKIAADSKPFFVKTNAEIEAELQTTAPSKTKKLYNISLQDSDKLELLIVEDNQEIREYICSCLDSSKYNFSQAVNGKEGLAIANEIIPDLIISDVMMPIMDGFEMINSIRNNITTSHIPIIILTAKTSIDSRIEGLETGADAYLNKPFSHKELNVRIRKLLEIRSLIQKFYHQLELDKDVPEIADKVSQKELDFIAKLKACIVQKIDDQQFGVEMLSKEMGMSRMQLHRKLKALSNRTAGELIKSTRLDKAFELLKEGNLNVSEIAYETGFSSPGYFSTSFKKKFNISPSEVLEDNRL